MIILVLVLMICGAGGALWYLRSQGGSAVVAINARLGRYGLLGATDAKPAAPEQSAAARSVEKLIARGGLATRIQELLESADLKLMPSEFLTISVVIGLVAVLIGLLLKGTVGMLGGGALGFVAPWFYLRRRVKKRRKQFLEQLADTAQMMANSLRAGFSILQAMELVGQEGQAPASVEFERVVTEVRLGLSFETALEHLMNRMPSEDLGLMLVAINVQRQIGGNLSDILGVIAETIRARVRFERDIKTMTAQARYSSYIITALPIGVGIVINLMDPSYESLLYTTTVGYMMLGASVTMLTLGFLALKKIANIEV